MASPPWIKRSSFVYHRHYYTLSTKRTVIYLRLLSFAEEELRNRVKQAGGKWNRNRKVWELRYERAVALKLEARIVEEASNTRYQG